MTDTRDALMRAILVDPADDTSRLVYADWLEENGEGARARAIRDQIESGESETYAGLKRAGTEPHDWPWCETYTVRSGFVAAVRCKLSDWVGGPCPCVNGHDYDSSGERTVPWCKSCKGTGRTLAHGPRIVAEQPVERVEITNARWSVRPGPFSSHIELPNVGRSVVDPKILVMHPDEESARKMLSDYLLNWARREAGLPPLEERT